MATEIWSAPADVVDLVNEVSFEHHPHLEAAPLAVLFRSPASKRKGSVVLGTARRSTPSERAMIGTPPAFVITLAHAEWEEADNRRRRALVDHELCHCGGSETEGWSMVGHDLEEFVCIVQRHGLWKEDLARFADAIQMSLDLSSGATPSTVEGL